MADIIWGAAAIAKVIGRTEKATFAMLESGSLAPAARKIGGRWCFCPAVFLSTFDAETGRPT